MPRKEVRHIRGRCLTLASDFGTGSYGHFLLDCIGRLHLFEAAGNTFADVDHILCPKPPSETADKILQHIGVPRDKCIWADELNSYSLCAECLIAPTFPGTRRNYPPWLPSYLRSKLLDDSHGGERRLYISRHGCRRNASNERAVERIVKSFDFEVYDPSGGGGSYRDFAEAAVIVGPHGGGLSDLAFCGKGTAVLELVPSDHQHPYFYTLSAAAGLQYHCMVCRSEKERPPGTFGPSLSDFHVDEQTLEAAVSELITSR
ncbi:glycosyltransferase family 61 protein [Alienimonas californiensis]